MAISTKFINAAVFISGARHVGPPTDAALVGTGFVAAIPTVDPDSGFMYVVTAAHVVRPFQSTFVRFSRHDGTVTDLRVPAESWVFHPVQDVAAAPIVLPSAEISLTIVPTTNFVGVAETDIEPGPGDQVFFPGLLGQVPAMGQSNMPMVRGGMIGALHQDGIPMRLPDDTVLNMHGHLIDCRSFGGFSGAPCFVDFVSGVDHTPFAGLAVPQRAGLLLGLVGGHFDLRASVALPAQDDKLRVPVAAGIAVLQTSQTIMEVLEDDDLVTARAADNAELRDKSRAQESAE